MDFNMCAIFIAFSSQDLIMKNVEFRAKSIARRNPLFYAILIFTFIESFGRHLESKKMKAHENFRHFE
jgi:hypothetical protein